VILSFLAAFGFIAGIFALVTLSDPVGSNPVARRSAIISKESFQHSIGLGEAPEFEEEEH
jgi:hypothetical protein